MYVFGDYVLDTQLFQLRLRDEVIPLEPKVFDVLRYLVENNDRVATKRELLAALWPNEVVTEAVLPTNINALRRALGQKRGDKLPIETVHGRGYRFSMPVTRSVLPPRSLAPSLQPSVMLVEPERDADPFVGQLAVTGRLKRSLAKAIGQQGQVCVLSGEAGIGKTRLAALVAELARANGAEVWNGVCSDETGTPPLWVWQQILRCVRDGEGLEKLREWLGPASAEYGHLLPELAEERSAPGAEFDAFRDVEAIARVIVQASQERARVITLEDMHRADDASWQILRLLAPQLERASVLLLITLRSRDDLTVVAPVQRNLDPLLRVPYCQTCHLRGLEEPETAELVQRLLARDVEPELVRLLHEKTGGNPLFVRELVDWLVVCGRFDAGALREAPDLAPPEMVRHVLRRRVERLGAAAQEVLEAGAVLGPVWDAMSVAHVTGLGREEVLGALQAALAARTVMSVAGRVETYRFAHDLLRDTLRADLTITARQRLHLRAAACFEERLPWLGADGLREVAHHLYQALPEGDAQRTVDWLVRAAEQAESLGAHSEAGRYYRCALDATRLLPVADPALRDKIAAARTRASERSAELRRRSQA